MIDEGHNLNAATASTLNSLLNVEERFVTAGGIKHFAPALRSIFFTGNATLPELLDYFKMQGQGPSGPAFLNRFQAKYRVPNWLSLDAQKKIDEVRLRRDFLRTLAPSHPKALADAVFLNPSEIDYVAVERLANADFELTPQAYNILREFVQELKDQTNDAKNRSEEKVNRRDPDEPYVLTPPVEFSERVRGDLAKWIRISAALDFLRSPMSSTDNIHRYGKHKIKLGPLSLWRTWNALTTVGPDRTFFNPLSKTVAFGAKEKNGEIVPEDFTYTIQHAQDRDERLELTHIHEANARFVDALKLKWNEMTNSQIEAARLDGKDVNDIDFETVDFEMALAQLGGTNVTSAEIPSASGASRP